MKPTEQPTLIIMAAGMGSRYGGLKQVDKITDARRDSTLISRCTTP